MINGAAERETPVHKRTLLSWALSSHRGLQALTLVLILAAVALRVFPVEMQKRIVNQAIAMSRQDLLFLYSGLYLAAVVSASFLKYVINVVQGYVGQKILQDMRDGLYRHVLRLPLSFFRRTPSGMVVSSLTSELAGVGEYLGQAVAVPVINVLTLLAFGGYMFWLDPILAAVSLATFPAELAVIPWLQRRLNRLNRKRIDATRSLSNVIGEAVDGMHEVHGNASYALEAERFQGLSHRLFRLRHRMNLHNFGIKFVNNFFQKLGPFTLFLVGGWLAIQGRFSLGELVAFLSAYDSLYDPWKELMDYYQLHQDSEVRYLRVMSYFDAEPEFVLAEPGRPPLALSGDVETRDLSFFVDGAQLLDDINLKLAQGEQMALVGFSGSGKSTLALVLGQLQGYDRGHVLVDGQELKNLTKVDVSANIAVVAQAPFIFSGTLRENLLYGVEALRLNGGSNAPPPGDDALIEVVRQVGLADDVLRLGLAARVDGTKRPGLARRVTAGRMRLRLEKAEELAELVEFYDFDRYLYHGDVYRNILFGEALTPDFQLEALPRNDRFVAFLESVGLLSRLLDLGAQLTARTTLLLRNLGDDVYFFQASPIAHEEFEAYSALAGRLGADPSGLDAADRRMLLRLALRFIPALHKMAPLSPELEEAILNARREFILRFGGEDAMICRLELGEEDGEVDESRPNREFLFYCRSQYISSQTLLENLLFGMLRADRLGAAERAQKLAVEFLEEVGAIEDVMAIGLEFEVGSKGDRLSGGQKQKTAIARALLKKPRILILDEATASLDNASQARIQRLLETELKGRCTVIAVAHRLDAVKDYDSIVVLRAGRVVEQGTYGELLARRGLFRQLVEGQGG